MVRQLRGYSYLPYRRDGSDLLLPRLRRRVEEHLAKADALPKLGSAFMVLAERAAPGRCSSDEALIGEGGQQRGDIGRGPCAAAAIALGTVGMQHHGRDDQSAAQ